MRRTAQWLLLCLAPACLLIWIVLAPRQKPFNYVDDCASIIDQTSDCLARLNDLMPKLDKATARALNVRQNEMNPLWVELGIAATKAKNEQTPQADREYREVRERVVKARDNLLDFCRAYPGGSDGKSDGH